MDKFIVVEAREAFEKEYPGYSLEQANWQELHHHALFETDGRKPVRLIGTDLLEPESVNLLGGLAWVSDELNQLARERDALHKYALRLLLIHKLHTPAQAEEDIRLEVKFYIP